MGAALTSWVSFETPSDWAPVVPAVPVEASVASEVICGACLSEIEDADKDTAFTNSSTTFGRTVGAISAGPTDGLP